MNLEARKIEFVQEFLKLTSEDVISKFEKILMMEKQIATEQLFEPMSEYELNKRIDQSEADFLANRYKSSAELLSKYE